MHQLRRIENWVIGGIYLLLLLLPFQTRYIFIESANPFGTVSVYGFDLLLILVGILWLIYWYRTPNLKPNWTSITLGIALLIVAGGASYFAVDKTVALYYWLHLALGLWLVAMLATTKLHHTALLSIFIFNGCVQTLAGIMQFVTQHVVASKWLGMSVQLPELSGASVVVTSTGRWLRAYALLPHPNMTGGVIVLALITAAFLSRRYWTLAIVGGVLSFGLLLTFSRGALVAWCVVLACLTITKQVRASFILTSLAALIVTIAIYWPLVSSRTLPSTVSENFTEQLSISERRQQVQQFSNIIQKRWPFGVGLGQYTLTAEPVSPLDYAQPIHNITLMLLAEMGVLGTVLWFCLVFQPLIHLGNRLVRHPASYGLLGILVLGMFDHYLWTLPTGLLLWLMMIGWLWLEIPQDQPKVTKTAR